MPRRSGAVVISSPVVCRGLTISLGLAGDPRWAKAEKLLWHGENSMVSTVRTTGEPRAGCSKRPDFSPAHPWRAETRLVPGKAVASEEVKAYAPVR